MLYGFIAVVITFLDQITKKTIRDHVKPHERLNFAGGKIFITNMKNSGAANGFLSNNPRLLHTLSAYSIFSIIRSYVSVFKSENNNAAYKLSFAMIMGGACGNMIDRITRKYVTDFICVPFAKRSPVFNVADFFIALGSLVLLGAAVFGRKRG